jgi:hypothetical protein
MGDGVKAAEACLSREREPADLRDLLVHIPRLRANGSDLVLGACRVVARGGARRLSPAPPVATSSDFAKLLLRVRAHTWEKLRY